MTTIEQAARREQAAERNRVAAETVWRQAWWATTLALGAPAESDKQGTTVALDTAQRILGQSRSWLASRRKVGRLLAGQPADAVHRLPPRLAIAYSDARGEPSRAIAVLRDAEQRGLSLRDFAAELGTQPQSWLREGEQAKRPVTVEQLTARPAIEQAAVIRRALENPDVARQVFTSSDAATRNVFSSNYRQQPPPPVQIPGRPFAGYEDKVHPRRPVAEPVPDPGLPDVLRLLNDARDNVVRAFGLAVLKNLTGNERVLSTLTALETECGSLRKYLNGAPVDEQHLARLMGADS